MGRRILGIHWLPFVLVMVAVASAGAILLTFADEIFPESSPAERGLEATGEAGCFACHSPASGSGVVNPKIGVTAASFGTVPSIFDERMTREEIRQWVENGVSDAQAKSEARQESRELEALKMPAYRDRLSSAEIDDVVSFVALMQYRAAVAERPPVARGEMLARQYSCFACHGEMGQGGVSNPGSLKRYVPGFFGSDFRALTRNGNREDLREWIRDGRSQHFWNQGVGGFFPSRYFSGRQAIQMPAYGKLLGDEEIDTLAEFLVELNRRGPLTAAHLLAYRPIPANPPIEVETVSDAAPEAVIGPRPVGGEGKVIMDAPVTATPGEVKVELPPLPDEPEYPGPFDRVREILEAHCVKCHGPEKQRSSFRMDTRAAAIKGGEIAEFTQNAAIVPGASDQSLMIRFVEAEKEDPFEEIYPMPPADNPRLTREEIEILRQWIDNGAEWTEGVSLAPKAANN